MSKMMKYILLIAIIFICNQYGPAWPLGEMADGKFYTIISTAIILTIYAIINIPAIYMVIGDNKYKKGDIKGAFTFFEKAYNTKRLSPKFMNYYGYTALKEGEMDVADKILCEVIENEKALSEEVYKAKGSLALVRWKQKRVDEGILLLEDVHEKRPDSETYGALGVLYIAKGDLDKAEEFAKEAYEYNDSNRTIADNLGEVYYLKGMYEEALEVYKKLIARHPQSPTPYYNYARVLIAMGDKEEAYENLLISKRFHFSNVTAITREMVDEELAKIE